MEVATNRRAGVVTCPLTSPWRPRVEEFCEPVDVVAVISADLTVIGWTEAGRCLWGYQGAEVLNRPARRLLAAPPAPAPLAC